MPYISAKDNRREKLRNGSPALTAGELNYQIFYYVKHSLSWKELYYNIREREKEICNIKMFVENFLGEKPNYQKYNDMTGCLVRCYKEIERRLNRKTNFLIKIIDSYDDEIARYEDTKIVSNGDVE